MGTLDFHSLPHPVLDKLSLQIQGLIISNTNTETAVERCGMRLYLRCLVTLGWFPLENEWMS